MATYEVYKADGNNGGGRVCVYVYAKQNFCLQFLNAEKTNTMDSRFHYVMMSQQSGIELRWEWRTPRLGKEGRTE
jgi:hypothetical protein